MNLSEGIALASVTAAIVALIVAVASAVFSRRSAAQAKRSADAAEKSNQLVEEQLGSRHIRWVLTGRWITRGELRYDLINRGRDTAHKVRITLPPGYEHLRVDMSFTAPSAPRDKAVSFAIRRRVSAADWQDPDQILSAGILNRGECARLEGVPETILVSCAEHDEPMTLLLPKPDHPQGQ